eukprot:c13397_g1_i1 orf=831-1742(-)
MDGVHQGHQLQPDYKQQHTRLTSARGGVTGPPQSLDFQEACTGTGYIPSSAVSWLPRHSPEISYRPIRPSDLDVIRELHEALFPVKYETEFFLNVVHGHGIISWAAVDTSRAGLLRDEIIGFVTTRVVSTEEVDTTGMLGYELAKAERDLVYILTLGVIKSYRNNGIASSLIHKVLDYASTIPTCRAVYLHVISYNVKAISFYEKNSFRCLQKLQNFYLISEHHYDAYLYIYYVNGGRSPCSALDFLISMRSLLSSFFASVVGRFWRKEPKKAGKWSKHKESGIFGFLCHSHGSMDSSTSVCV